MILVYCYRRMLFRGFLSIVIFLFAFSAFAGKEYLLPLDKNAEILVSGKISVGRILFLTGAQYTQYFYENKLSPIDLVVVDQFPTELDPFPLAGVITESHVQPGCHMERQATKIQIPFLTLNGAMSNSILRDLAKTKSFLSFEVNLANKTLKIKTDISEKVAQKIFQSRLKPIPISQYRETYDLIQPLRDVPYEYLEHYGQKLKSIHRASAGQTQTSLPMIIGVPADVFLKLIRETLIHVNGESLSLGDAIRKQMIRIKRVGLFSEEVPKLLLEIQTWFDQVPYREDIFDPLMLMIDSQFRAQGGTGASLRLRSSNRVEDKIGAGAYRSIHLPFNEWTPRDIRVLQIFGMYIDMAKSLYTPRAFILRQMFGLDESLTDIAGGYHVSEDALKGSGIAFLELVNGYRILKLVIHPPGGSGTSPLAGSQYETIYLIENPSGEIRFSPDGLISNKEPFEPSITSLTRSEILSLFTEVKKSGRNWGYYESQGDKMLFEWGVKEDGEPRLFDTKELNNNLVEAPRSPPDFGLSPESNEILGQLGFQTFESGFQTRAFNEDGKISGKKIEVSYLYVQIDHQNVLLTTDDDTSTETALELISDGFKQNKVKLLSAGVIQATIQKAVSRSQHPEVTSMSILEKSAIKAFTEDQAKEFLFALFGSHKVRPGYADLDISPSSSAVSKYSKKLSKGYRNSMFVVSTEVRKAVYGDVPQVQTIAPFSNIAPDVADVLINLGLKDVQEILMESALKHPFSIGATMGWHILMLVDGTPKVVIIKDHNTNHTSLINTIESTIEALPVKHEIKFLQFGDFDAEIIFPGRVVSLDIHSSIFSRNRFDFKMISLWLEAIRLTGVEFAADAHFLNRASSSDFINALSPIFKNRRLPAIPLNEVLEVARGMNILPAVDCNALVTHKGRRK